MYYLEYNNNQNKNLIKKTIFYFNELNLYSFCKKAFKKIFILSFSTIRPLINFFFKYKFLRVNFFYYLPKYKMYKNLNFLNLNENSVVIDFGANVGNFSLYIYDKFNSKLYCYEPNPYCCQYLKKIFNKNPKVKIFNKGVSNTSTILNLYLAKSDSAKYSLAEGCSYSKNKTNVSSENFIKTKTENIKKILLKYKYIDLLKIDIEGWEYKIINHVIKNIYKIKTVYIELHQSGVEQKKNYYKTLKLLKKKKLLNNKIFMWF